MKIEVIASGKGSITIKTDSDDYTSAEIMSMARRAANITTKMVKDVSPAPKKFGFEAGADVSLSWPQDGVPAELPDVDRDAQ